MRLRTFHARDGDCLLLTSRDGRHLLIDGGRRRQFVSCAFPTLAELRAANEPIDLAVVSHIDADHIEGMLWLVDHMVRWVAYRHQSRDGQDTGVDPPEVLEPPEIHRIWHNSFSDQLGDLEGPILSRLGSARNLLRAVSGEPSIGDAAAHFAQRYDLLAESVSQGYQLSAVIDHQQLMERNAPFRDLVIARDPPHVEQIGSMRLTVLGPTADDLRELREEWADELDKVAAVKERLGLSTDLSGSAAVEAGLALAGEVAPIDRADEAGISVRNLASITLLAEETDTQGQVRACLLTGDAAASQILAGLERAGRLDNGPYRCRVLKVQHHGSEFNLDAEFAARVQASNYVFCANGAHENPDLRVLATIIDERVDARPYSLWFNCSPTRPDRPDAAPASDHMGHAIEYARRRAERDERIRVKVLDDDRDHFDIPI